MATSIDSVAADAARKAAEEAARKKAAEEAAKKAAEEAAKKAAEEAAKRMATEEKTLVAQAVADSLEPSTASQRMDLYAGDGSPTEMFQAEHSVAFSQLPEDQQQKLAVVVERLTDPATQNNRLANRTYEDLGHLLDSGVLQQRDATGKTIIDHLAARLDQPLVPELAEGLNPAQQAGAIHDLIHSVAHPESINQGEGTFTCTTAVIQTLTAISYPADYVGMVTGLMYDGAGRTPAGDVVKLDTSELYLNELPKRTGRGIVDAVVQGSLLAYAEAKFPADGKGVEGGRFSTRYTFGGGRFSTRATFGGEERGGLTSAQVGGLLEKVLGIKTQDIEVTEANRDLAFGMFTDSLGKARDADKSLSAREQRALQNGIPVGVETPDGRLHEVLVTDTRDGKVVYMDPVDGKNHEMPEAEFKEALRSVKVPASAPSRFQQRGTGDLSAASPDQKVLYARLKGMAGFGTYMV